MKSFLKESELEEVNSYSGDCSCCDICQNACTCGNFTLLPLEKLFSGTSKNVIDVHVSEDSDSDSNIEPE